MFSINQSKVEQHSQDRSHAGAPTLKRTVSTAGSSLSQSQKFGATESKKKSRLVQGSQSDQARNAVSHNTSLHSHQLSSFSDSSSHPITPRIPVHYIPLTALTANDTDAKHMAETFSQLSGRDVHYCGNNALIGATEIAFHGHGDLGNNTLSYLVNESATWSANPSVEGHQVVDLNEDHRLVVLSPNELLTAMQSDGFVPNEFTGTIRSYSCQGSVFLKNFMQSTWPNGKQDVVGIASDWNVIMHPDTSAQEIMYLMKNGGDAVTIVEPGEDFMIQFPDGAFQQKGEWAGRYDDSEGEYVFRPKVFTEVKFTFSGNTLQEEKIGEQLLNATKVRSMASTRP